MVMEVGSWVTLFATVLFSAILVSVVILVTERFGKVWAPILIVCFLSGMSIVFDYGGARQTELTLFNTTLFFACGPMMWPVIALGQDYLNEFYGKKIALNYTFGIFLAKVGVALATIWIIFFLPVPVSNEALGETARTFNSIMAGAPRINISSIVAAIASFATNIYIFSKLKEITKGKHLWLRNIASSLIASTVDSILFFFGSFAFVLPWGVIWNNVFSYLLICVVTIVIDLAFLYIMVHIKRKGLFGIHSRVGEKLTIQTMASEEVEKETRTAAVV